MKKEKIIFLDIDGVIATLLNDNGVISYGLNPEKQDLLAILLEKTNANIVLSSSWRENTVEETRVNMTKEGFRFSDKIIGVTVRGHRLLRKDLNSITLPRGVEIEHWIDMFLKYPWKGHPERDEEFKTYNKNGIFNGMKHQKLGKDYVYVILDDDTDMLLEQKKYFIKCNPNEGLTLENINKAIKILNK